MAAFRARTRAIERTVDDAVAAVKAHRDAEWDERAAVVAAERAARAPITATDLADAVIIHDKYGWQKIIRVNTKTVTVADTVGTRSVKYKDIQDYRPRSNP